MWLAKGLREGPDPPNPILINSLTLVPRFEFPIGVGALYSPHGGSPDPEWVPTSRNPKMLHGYGAI